ncbi:hypothetical protein [Hydrogenimonas sp. SS33]|uniref:hypothetical protein n=1 Tax=Hydrogenimonas leucolamina TaxID=2954236 RepID=UPI00336BDF9A
MDIRPLLDLIARKTVKENTGTIQEAVIDMLCNESQPIPLGPETLREALQTGEFLILRLHYDDFKREREEGKIAKKIPESLHIVATFEEDGHRLEEIEDMIQYFHGRIDDLQTYRFGIKRVETLSEFPVTILFGGILPINQLRVRLGRSVAELVETHRSHFEPLFKKVRFEITEKTGIPLLPVETVTDTSIPPRKVMLEDPLRKRMICDFEVAPFIEKEGLEIYLLKIYYVFRLLSKETKEHLRRSL